MSTLSSFRPQSEMADTQRLLVEGFMQMAQDQYTKASQTSSSFEREANFVADKIGSFQLAFPFRDGDVFDPSKLPLNHAAVVLLKEGVQYPTKREGRVRFTNIMEVNTSQLKVLYQEGESMTLLNPTQVEAILVFIND